MRRLWEYVKSLRWMLAAGLMGIAVGVTCLAAGLGLSRGEPGDLLEGRYGQEDVGLLLTIGLALVFMGTVASLLSRRSC